MKHFSQFRVRYEQFHLSDVVQLTVDNAQSLRRCAVLNQLNILL